MTDYQRVSEICSSDQRLGEYSSLFSEGYENMASANEQFTSAFGDSYAYLDPTIYNLAQQAAISTFSGPDISERKDICISDAFASSMTLDQVRIQTLPTH